jgi:hypothetical protein
MSGDIPNTTTNNTTTIHYHNQPFTLSWRQGTVPTIGDVVHLVDVFKLVDLPFRQTCRLFDILDTRPRLTPILQQLCLDCLKDQFGNVDRQVIDCRTSDWRQTPLFLSHPHYTLSSSSTSKSELRTQFISDLGQAFQKQISDSNVCLSVTKMPNEFVQKYQTGFGWYYCLTGREAPMPYMSCCYQMMNNKIAHEWRPE